MNHTNTKLDQDLTARELEVFNLLKTPLMNKEIGFQLGCKEKTVKFHITGIFKKLGCKSRRDFRSKFLTVDERQLFEKKKTEIQFEKHVPTEPIQSTELPAGVKDV